MELTPTASSGSSAASVFADVATLLGAVGTDANSKLHLVLSPSNAKALASKSSTGGLQAFPSMAPQGGSLAGIMAHTSDAVGTNVLLIDSSGFAADPGSVILELGRHASLRFVDEGSPPN